MSKLSFRESMLNMLGEFVALKRNPEFRLSPKSSQFIDEAMKTEYERSKIAFDDLDNQISSSQSFDRRQSDPVYVTHKRPSLFGRFRSKKSKKSDRTGHNCETVSTTSSSNGSFDNIRY